jgi:hypothetical protein
VSRRSVTNDRYKKDFAGGTTRKSAASVKPKREAGESASSVSKSKPKAKKGPSRTAAKRPASARVPDSPEVKRLRKYWWGFMAAALLIAVLLVPITSNKVLNQRVGSVVVGLYAAALGGALYLEFGPIRKARAAAVAAAKKDEKPSKPKGGKSAPPVAPPVEAASTRPSWMPSWWPFGKTAAGSSGTGSTGSPTGSDGSAGSSDSGKDKDADA